MASGSTTHNCKSGGSHRLFTAVSAPNDDTAMLDIGIAMDPCLSILPEIRFMHACINRIRTFLILRVCHYLRSK